MATPKKASLIFEMQGKQFTLKEIEDAAKTVKGAKTAYVNVSECAVYCVDGNGDTIKVELNKSNA